MNGSGTNARSGGIDLVKAAAILGVIILHVSTYGCTGDVTTARFAVSLGWGSLVRASVPLFFLCSGALLLPPEKDLPLRRLYGKNILKIVLAMLAWGLFYMVFHLLRSGGATLSALWEGVKGVLLFRQEFHLYFLHIILLVYALLPVTRLVVRHASRSELKYALGLWFVLGVLYPTLRPFWPFTLLSGIPLQWMMNMSYAAVGYGVLGYVLTRHTPSPRLGWLCAGAGLALVFVPTLLLSRRSGVLENTFLEGMSVGVCLLAVGLFVLLYRLGQRLRGRPLRAATALSKASFGIFLVHVVWLNVFQDWGWTAAEHPAAVAIPAFSLAILGLSWLCAFVLSKIPAVKTWLV